ncbi:SAM-dependent methyltransferase [Aphanothece hegewaldii CCALA 016]|uniref:SAM-dependent methyltransferase n=1 Tax=Aphanothece hegewaldii CCALA 016 TaxID=2107694 RepID=A0A2T1LXE1_9CHRO|nr:class I SAM-dependent methyltransferase [Aphanothece hegewaldii]PSF36850.1 SAM-dependent methyltransferase [Aphanothece hegewaldii CCALA 016]
MQRILEDEVMDTLEEAIEYDAMDFTEVNTNFAQRAIVLAHQTAKVLDVGTGTARIPILIAQQRPTWNITGIDLAKSMLDIGFKNIAQANLEQQIHLEVVDAKQMPYTDAQFDLVLSNSLLHHLPNPLPFLKELNRVLKPNGGILLRDLLRPASKAIINEIVEQVGEDYTEHQKKLFWDSLHAAFTLEEIAELLQNAGLEKVKIYQSSERHWTAEREYQ